EGDARLSVGARRGELAQEEPGDAEGEVGLKENPRVADPPGQSEALLPEASRLSMASLAGGEQPQTPQNREELAGLAHLLAKIPSPFDGPRDLRSAIAPRGHEGRNQRRLQVEF